MIWLEISKHNFVLAWVKNSKLFLKVTCFDRFRSFFDNLCLCATQLFVRPTQPTCLNQKPCFSLKPFSTRERAYPAAESLKLLSPTTPKPPCHEIWKKKRACLDLCSWVDTMCSSKFFLKEPLVWSPDKGKYVSTATKFMCILRLLRRVHATVTRNLGLAATAPKVPP